MYRSSGLKLAEVLPGSVNPRRVLVAAIVCAVLLRALLAVWIIPGWEKASGVPAFPDDYPSLAHSLLHDGSLGYRPGSGASPTTARGPGFPAWLAVGIAFAGEDGRWLGFWSAVPMLILAPLLARQAWQRFGPYGAAAAFVLLVFHPLPAGLSGRVMSDEFYAAAGFGALLLWDRAVSDVGTRSSLLAGGAGLLSALQMLTRSSGLLSFVVLFALGIGRARRRAGLLLIFALCALIPPLAWSVRSSRLEGRPVFVHSLVAYNFWLGEGFDRFGYSWTSGGVWPKVAQLLDSKGGLPGDDKEKFYYPDLRPKEIAELERRLSSAAVDRIKEDPPGYGMRFLRGLYRFWIQAQSTPRTIQYGISFVVVLALALPALRPAAVRREAADMIFLGSVWMIVVHNVAYAAILPVARFSVQVWPEVAWLLAVGVGHLTTKPLSQGPAERPS